MTPEDVFRQELAILIAADVRIGKAADLLINALDAAGYVIQAKQEVWNTERMRAALIGIAAMKRTDPEADAKWAAQEAADAIKWCMENSAKP